MQSNSAVGMFLTFPTSRISYQVVSKIGSRTVLDTQGSEKLLGQRRLKLGYLRAARLIEIMEANGVVGPSQVEAARGTAPRRRLSFYQWADLNPSSQSLLPRRAGEKVAEGRMRGRRRVWPATEE